MGARCHRKGGNLGRGNLASGCLEAPKHLTLFRVAVQLSLSLPDPRAQPRQVWFLSAREGDQGALHRILSQGAHNFVDALDGRSIISSSDFMLVRLGDDVFKAWGCPPDRLEADSYVDLTAALADSIIGGGHSGRDLIGFCRGRRVPDRSETQPATPIEDLFRLLRQEHGQLSLSIRRRICQRALANLGDDQPRVRALLIEQWSRLTRLLHADQPVRSFARRGSSGAENVILLQGDLFIAPRARPIARDLSLQSIRVHAVCVPLRPNTSGPFAQLAPGGQLVRVDETAIAAMLEPLSSHRLVGTAAWSSISEAIEACVDWEVRMSFSRLVSCSLQTPPLRVWLETRQGDRASLAAMARVGEKVKFGPAPRLVAEGTAAGVVAFEDAEGRRARSPFRLSKAA